jgi:hypothetical protein
LCRALLIWLARPLLNVEIFVDVYSVHFIVDIVKSKIKLLFIKPSFTKLTA